MAHQETPSKPDFSKIISYRSGLVLSLRVMGYHKISQTASLLISWSKVRILVRPPLKTKT